MDLNVVEVGAIADRNRIVFAENFDVEIQMLVWADSVDFFNLLIGGRVSAFF